MLRVPPKNPFPDVLGTFMGRDAFALAVSSLGLGVDDTVLLPAYLCREVLKPFLGKTQVEFYDLGSDLTVDPEKIKLKLSKGNIKLLVIINYFGFLQPYRKEIKTLCADKGTVLLEDCAHSLLTEGSGEVGDLSIYSFRKLLPVPDGGGLKMNMKGKKVIPDFHPKIYSNFLSALIIMKLLMNVRSEFFSRAGLSSQAKILVPNSGIPQRNHRILPQSSFSYNGMGNVSFPEIIENRRRDYQYWQEMSERTDRFVPIFSKLPSGVCPLGCPVTVKDRDWLKSRLEEKRIFLNIHWHIPATIGNEFVNSHRLSREEATLPVFPELGRKEREEIERLLTA